MRYRMLRGVQRCALPISPAGERHSLPARQQMQDPTQRRVARVRMEADELGARADVGEQRLGVACVLGRDGPEPAQRAGPAWRGVLEGAEPRGPDGKGGWPVTTTPAPARRPSNPAAAGRCAATPAP